MNELITDIKSRKDSLTKGKAVEKENSSIIEKTKSLGEAGFKVSAIIAAAGYIAIREQLKYLGLPTNVEFGINQYLVTVWQMIHMTVSRIVLPLLVIAFLWVIIRFILLLTHLEKHKPVWLQRIQTRMISVLPIFLIWTGILNFIGLINSFNTCQLIGDKLADNPAMRDVRWFDGLVLHIIAIGIMLYYYRKQHRNGAAPNPNRLAPSFRLPLNILLGLLIVYFPIAYGRLVMSTEYPRCSFWLTGTCQPEGMAKNTPIDGLLFNGSTSHVTFYTLRRNVPNEGKPNGPFQAELMTLKSDCVAGFSITGVEDIFHYLKEKGGKQP